MKPERNGASEFAARQPQEKTTIQQIRFNKARVKLQVRIEDLEALADWRDELQSRIRRSQLIFEFVDCYHRDETLAAEVKMFKEVCEGLAGSRKEPLPERKAA
jgi:hypothetical protein